MDDLKNDGLEMQDELLEESPVLAPELNGDLLGTTEEVLERYCHCHLCGSNLHFTYSTDFAKNLTHETARCPECGIRARQLLHKLQ